MKKVWMFLAAFALIAAVPSCGDSDEPVTPPLNGGDSETPTPPIDEDAPFTLKVSNVVYNDFSLSVTPNGYTGNYYVAAVSGAENFTGEQIAEQLIAVDLEEGNNLSTVDNEYIYSGAASIPSLAELWMIQAGSNVKAVVFGVSGQGDILTDVVVAEVQLPAPPASGFSLSVSEITATSALVTVSSEVDRPFYFGAFQAELVQYYGQSLPDALLSTIGAEKLMESVFKFSDGETSGNIRQTGLTPSTDYAVVVFGFENGEITTTMEAAFYTTEAGDVTPGEYTWGTISVSNPTDYSVDLQIIPSNPTKPYVLSVEAVSYVNQFSSDADLFDEEMAFWYYVIEQEGLSYKTVYEFFQQEDFLYSGSIAGTYGSTQNPLNPGTEYCAYVYYMDASETLDGDIAKAYFKTTGTAPAAAKAVKARTSLPRNYVERLAERPTNLGTASVPEISLPQARQFGKR